MNNRIYADAVFLNGHIVTVDKTFSIAEAVAVRDGKILAVGKNEDILPLSGPQTDRIDLQGRTMLPGINDVHIHLALGGYCLLHGGKQEAVLTIQTQCTTEEIRKAYEAMFQYLLQRGVTSVTDGELGPRYNNERGGLAGSRSIGVLNDMMNEGSLPLRVGVMFSLGRNRGEDASLEWLSDRLPNLGWHSGFGNEWLRITGLKLFADGATGMKTALNYENYPDGTNGRLKYVGQTDEARHDELVKIVCLAHRCGFRVGIHCCGDKAVDAVADAYIAAQQEIPSESRDYFIHGDLITKECIERISHYSLGYSAFIPTLWAMGNDLKRAVPEQRRKHIYPLKSLMKAGVVCTAHTDFPFSPTDWRLGMQCCVLRQAVEGTEVWGTEEAISVEDAIKLYTINAAWQTGEENIKGSIEVGKLADFCVLGEDILTMDPHRIKDVPVAMTVVDGKIAYSAQ